MNLFRCVSVAVFCAIAYYPETEVPSHHITPRASRMPAAITYKRNRDLQCFLDVSPVTADLFECARSGSNTRAS